MPIHTFFIYGTMRAGEQRHKQLVPYLEKPAIPAVLPCAALYSVGAWPFIILDAPKKYKVHGDLLFIQPDQVDLIRNALDGLEGYIPKDKHSLFIRTIVQVVIADGEVEAYTYVAGPELVKQVDKEYIVQLKHGDWSKRT